MLKKLSRKEAWKLLERVYDGEISEEEFLDMNSVVNTDIDWETFVATDGGFPLYSIEAAQDEKHFSLKVSIMQDQGTESMWEKCYKIPNQLLPCLDEIVCDLEMQVPYRNFEEFIYRAPNGKEYYSEEEMVTYLLRQELLFVNARKYLDVNYEGVRPSTLVLFVNLSDTFMYACADAEEINLKDLRVVCEMYCKYGYSGVVNWASKKRGIRPIKPVQEHMKKVAVECEKNEIVLKKK